VLSTRLYALSEQSFGKQKKTEGDRRGREKSDEKKKGEEERYDK
jgi:hypothetical protein